MLNIITIILTVIYITMTLGAILAWKLKNTGIVDIFWAMTPLIVCWKLYQTVGSTMTELIFLVLVAVWSLRLALFLLFTRVLKNEKDHRYIRIENKWKGRPFFKVLKQFYIQAFFQMLLCAVMIPIYLTKTNTLNTTQIIAIILFLIAIIGETISDHQLYLFKKSKQKGVFKKGLWKYSRHPNYLFEFIIWVSLALFSVNTQLNLIAWISPISIYCVMRYITGPITEKSSLERRGDDYKRYQESVGMIIPKIKK